MSAELSLPIATIIASEMVDERHSNICEMVDDRFTLLAPDDFRGDMLEIACYDGGGKEVARESLYEDDE